MPIVRVDNVGSVGLNGDLEPEDLPPEAWTQVNNVRFDDGKAEKFSGHEAIFDAQGAIEWMLPYQQHNPNKQVWLYASGGLVYATDGTTNKTIDFGWTPAANVQYTGGILAGRPIYTNGAHTPKIIFKKFDDGAFGAGNLWSDASESRRYCRALRVFRDFAVAMGIDYTPDSSGLEDLPNRVWWSHPYAQDDAENETQPDWDVADATLLAGVFDLSHTGGPIVDGGTLRNTFYIYKQDAVFSMQYVGGVQVFRFDPYLDTSGAINGNCLARYRQNHLAFGFDDVIIHDGSRTQSLLDRRLKRWLYRQIDESAGWRSFMATDPVKKEVWICFPTTGETIPNVAVVWNAVENSFGVRDLPGIGHIAYGEVPTLTEDDPWDPDTEVWDDDLTVWGETIFNPANQSLVAAGTTNSEFYQLNETNTAAGTNLEVLLERRALSLVGRDRQGNPKSDTTVRKFVRSIRPRMEGSGVVNISVGGHETPDGPIMWDGPYAYDTMDPDSFKVDVNVSGRFLAVKFESDTDVWWRLTGYDLDIEPLGAYG